MVSPGIVRRSTSSVTFSWGVFFSSSACLACCSGVPLRPPPPPAAAGAGRAAGAAEPSPPCWAAGCCAHAAKLADSASAMITRIFMDDLLGTGFRLVEVTREYTRGGPTFRLSLFANASTGIQVYAAEGYL